MFLSFLSWISRKVYKIWMSSIEIIYENENENEDEDEDEEYKTIKPSISQQKFIYPETVILDLSRPVLQKR